MNTKRGSDMQIRSILSGLFLLILSAPAAASLCYVDYTASGNDDGSTWTDAYRNVAQALLDESCTEMWVTGGYMYQPGQAYGVINSPELSFELRNGLAIYGGFPPGGGSWGDRDFEEYPTTLWGDYGADQSYHVVTGSNTDHTAILDGFTITGGEADGDAWEEKLGGGIYIESGSPTLANLIITDNTASRGGGLYTDNASPTLTNVRFTDNSAFAGGGIYSINGSSPTLTNVSFITHTVDNAGGSMFNEDSSPVLTDVLFSSSSAGYAGGAMFNAYSSPVMTNVVFRRCSAAEGGGAMYNAHSSPTLTNVRFSGNTATHGGGIGNDASSPVLVNVTFNGNAVEFYGGALFNAGGSNPTLTNVVMWDNEADGDTGSTSASIYSSPTLPNSNPIVNYSMIDNCYPGGPWQSACGTNGVGNMNDRNPRFVDPVDPAHAPTAAGDLRLLPSSPVANVGDNDANDSEFDLAGNARITDGVIDLGAYEFNGMDCPSGGILYVSQQATGAADGSSWESAVTELRHALTVTENCEIRVAAGTYKPGTARSDSFQLKSDVQVYGGFPPAGGDWEDRNWATHETILSGDIDASGTLSGNSYHVVLGNFADETAVLDGFIVTGGNADAGSGADALGGGMRTVSGSPTLANLIFRNNYAFRGAGMYNVTGSDPVLTNVAFSGNRANHTGGGMHNGNGSSPTLINVSFGGNNSGGAGGAIRNDNSSPILINVVAWNNWAGGTSSHYLATISNYQSDPVISHSLLAYCKPGGVWNDQCGTGSFSNIPDEDPRFEEPIDPATAPSSGGSLRIVSGSPALDGGDNSANDGSSDLAGNPRVHNGTIDLGAYEFPGRFDCPAGGVVHVGLQGSQSPNGETWNSAFDDLQDALAVDGPCEIHVAAGEYVPGPARDDSFQLKNQVGIYGGFPPGGGGWSERDWAAHETTLSGDVDRSGTLSGNAYHVVLGNFTDESAVLDGFVISGGTATEPSGASALGGGIRNVSGSPTLANLLIRNNFALRGGGMYTVTDSAPTLFNVAFSGNSAVEHGAGLFINNNSAATLINASFSGNRAGDDGGAIGINSSSASLTNVVIWNNRAPSSSGNHSPSIHLGAGSSSGIAYSLIEHCNPDGNWNTACGSDGGSNLIDGDPVFVQPANPFDVPNEQGNLRLRVLSPGVDGGDNGANDTLQGLGGNPRVLGAAIDIGAYETPYVTATASIDGQGSVSISPDQPRFDPGTDVTITATPGAGWFFAGWSGDASSSDNPLPRTLNDSLAVTAHFEINTYAIDIGTEPFEGGSALCTPNPVDHGSDSLCTADAATGYSFTGWSGDCSGSDCELVNVTTSLAVTAAFELDAYTVGGTVSGLAGEGLVLRDNGGDDLAIESNGSFEFATPIDHLSAYQVTVWSQPDNPLQRCTVSNGEGEIDGSDVTDVVVECVDQSDMIFSDRYQQ